VSEAIEYLEDGEQPRWRRAREIRLVPSFGSLWVARFGVAALVAALAAATVFAVNAVGLSH